MSDNAEVADAVADARPRPAANGRQPTIHKAIVHKLVKDQHHAIQDSVYRDHVLDPANKHVQTLVNSLIDVYATRYNRVQYGVFASGPARGDFPDAFERYAYEEQPSEGNFIELSRGVAMDALYRTAMQQPAASGGYIVFADVTEGGSRHFYIVMIKDQKGLRLTSDLNPEELLELDLKRIHQGCRVSFNKLAEFSDADRQARQEIRYLSFVSPSATQQAAGYFVLALGCEAGTASKKATDTVIREGERFFMENEALRPHRSSFKSELIGYLQEKAENKNPARLGDITHIVRNHMPVGLEEAQVDEFADRFNALMNSEEHQVSPEFPVNQGVVNKFTYISGKAGDVEISFKRTALGTNQNATIFYNRDAQTLTLTEIPEDMVAKIESELRARDQ